MKGKRYSEEQIIYALKAAEGGQKAAHVCRELGVTEVTFYRWKKQYAGMGITELRKLKLLEEENRKAQGNDLSTPLPDTNFQVCSPATNGACTSLAGNRPSTPVRRHECARRAFTFPLLNSSCWRTCNAMRSLATEALHNRAIARTVR
jgi:putative transposase